jgi:hypothetical protein
MSLLTTPDAGAGAEDVPLLVAASAAAISGRLPSGKDGAGPLKPAFWRRLRVAAGESQAA